MPRGKAKASTASPPGNFMKKRSAISVAAIAVVGIAMAWFNAEPGRSDQDLLQQLGATGRVMVRTEPIVSGGPAVRGIFASQNIRRGEVVLSVPWKSCLWEGNVQAEAKQLCEAPGSNCTAVRSGLLILGLALERRAPRPEFQSYIKSMPTTATNFKAFAPELQSLVDAWDPVWVETHINAPLKAVTRMGASLEPPLSEEEANWATNQKGTRTFSQKISDQHGFASVMIPGADHMNHNEPPSVSFPECDVQQGWCSVRASRDVSRHEQIFVSYGPFSNFAFLVRFGFTLPSNPAGPRLTLHGNAHAFSAAQSVFPAQKRPWLQQLGCPAFTVRMGPRLDEYEGRAVLEGDGILKCLFANEAFNTAEAADSALEARATNGLDKCFPKADPSSCEVEEWKKASARVHAWLERQCKAQDRWHAVEPLLPAAKALRDHGNLEAAQLLDALQHDHALLSQCTQYHGERMKAWGMQRH